MRQVLSSLSFLLIIMVSLVAPYATFADEKIGDLYVDMIRLRPTLYSSEDTGGDFSLSDSAFALRWQKDKYYSAYVEIGSEIARNPTVYYNTLPEDKLGFIEAYAQYDGVYGQFRLGLIPLNFGYDGKIKNSDRIFSRSLVFSKRLIGLTDQGISFSTDHNGYYTQLTAHNGEVDAESDGNIWVSANWGHRNDKNYRTQLSLQTGEVDDHVSNSAPYNSTLGVITGEKTKWRNALLYYNWFPRQWNIVAEVGGGEYEQKSKNGSYSNVMIEVSRYFTKTFSLGVRFDEMDPNRKENGDKLTEASLAMVFKTTDATSKLILLGTKSFQERNEIADDKFYLIWLLTPYSR